MLTKGTEMGEEGRDPQASPAGRHLSIEGPLAIKGSLDRRLYMLVSASTFLFVLIAWSVLTYGQWVKPFFLPTPGDVVRATIDLFVQFDLVTDIKTSFYRVTVGYLLACGLAVPLGLLAGSFKLVEALVAPINDFIRYMPVPAFVPLTILWIGVDDRSQIALIFIGTFFQLLVMVADGVAQVPREYLEAGYTLGTRRGTALLDVVLPYSLPHIWDTLRVAFGWAWSYLLLAEVVAASTGLGHMIMESQRYLRTANVIAGIFIIGTIGLVIDVLFRMAYRQLFPWTEKS